MARPSVLGAIKRAFTPLEGWVPFIYTDANGNPTTGLGHLLAMKGNDAAGIAAARGIFADDPDQAEADYRACVAAWPGVQSTGCAAITRARLTDEAIQALADRDVDTAETYLRRDLPMYDSWPADAQLAALSNAWALGGAWVSADHFSTFQAAANSQPPQFGAAGPLAHYHGAGSAPRIAMNDRLWANAQAVLDTGADPDVLYWPGEVPGGSTPVAGGGTGPLMWALGIGFVLTAVWASRTG